MKPYILFVCSANTCRSAMAEALFNHYAEQAGISLRARSCGLDAEGNIITRSFEEIAEIARASKIPVVVGGGVKLADIPSLAQTGVDGFFVVSAVAGAPDPEKAAAELVKAWRENARKS